MILGQYGESDVFYGESFGVGYGLNLLCGIAATIIISRKGHGAYQVVLHLLVGVFCCGIGALISSLVARDLEQERKGKQLAEQVRVLQVRSRTAHDNAGDLGQVRCPRCGSMNAVELVACWHCGLELVVEERPVKLPALARKPLPLKAKPADDHEAIRAKLEEKLRIECKACGKQMQGKKMKVQSLKRCPKCGAAPFDYRQLPKA